LVSEKAANAESAKLTALFDLLEPIIAEGHKVLVFSQFITMLGIIRAEIERREWRHFLLTGDTEERGPLVQNFQQCEGAAVFLISLRAGGFGLNLTAASYVVLYDPWWNPAVENQAIDRTHRIGQTSQVFAYRLVVKDSIEEKIRKLQSSKSALADDILGEESFTRALTLDDFRFLLGE
jgi:SNF2 family DNA or RNA helicase